MDVLSENKNENKNEKSNNNYDELQNECEKLLEQSICIANIFEYITNALHKIFPKKYIDKNKLEKHILLLIKSCTINKIILLNLCIMLAKICNKNYTSNINYLTFTCTLIWMIHKFIEEELHGISTLCDFFYYSYMPTYSYEYILNCEIQIFNACSHNLFVTIEDQMCVVKYFSKKD